GGTGDLADRTWGGRRRQARTGRLRHPARGGGRGSDLRFAHPRGLHRRERPRVLVRLGQPAQGGRPERRPDRREPREPRPAAGETESGVIPTALIFYVPG